MNRKTREALFVHAEGHSRMSGEPLTESWEVDHKTPQAAGGTDDILNLQAVNEDENRAKSAAHPPALREWQQDFIRTWRRETRPSFLLVALPGAGKTLAALTVAQEWIDADPVRRKVVVIVPTDALRTQWQKEAAALFGIQLQSREFDSWKSSMAGFVLSYQGLAGHSQLWQLRCHQYQILVICDEIHHASDRNDWGFDLREAFSAAARRLLTSGTPFRGDSNRIPFVEYDSEGCCVPHYRYDYPGAVRDGVIRVVRFQHEKGIVRRLTATGEESVELSSELPEDEANDALYQILRRPGKYTEELLRIAHAQLVRCRETMPHAGGLVVCCDQDHAQQIAKQLAGIIGHAPDVIVSDDDRTTSTVESFRSSARMWVVAVRQISEGVDIPRLMVLAYLTHYRTSLFFRQAVGRIVRNMGTPEDMEAYCVIPDHPVLVQHARQITEAQVQAILEEPEDPKPRSRSLEPALFPDIVLGTEHTGTAGTIIEGETLSPPVAQAVTALAIELGCNERVALRVLKKYGQTPSTSSVTSAAVRSHQRPLEDQLDAARAEVLRKVRHTAFRLLPDDPDKFPKVNHYATRLIGKKRELFTLDDCRRVIEHLSGLTRIE